MECFVLLLEIGKEKKWTCSEIKDEKHVKEIWRIVKKENKLEKP